MVPMAKFSRLLLGGVVGAGLAYLFSRKDVRRRLMGGGQAQLMAPRTPVTNIPVTGHPPAAAPVAEPVEATVAVPVEATVEEPVEATVEEPVEAAEAEETVETVAVVETPPEMDLEATIEETRRQVEEQFEAPAPMMQPPAVEPEAEVAAEEVETAAADAEGAAAVEDSPEAIEELIDTGEAPEILLEEEEDVSASEVTEDEMDEADAEALTEAVETDRVETAAEEKSVELEAVISDDFTEAPVAEPESDEFADLRTPVEGEPTTAESETTETVTVTDAGPAPSQMDRDEMRRRIDETRARLKAKAFDALVSGETFIEPETEEGGHKKKEAAEVDIDSEIGDQIDRSLREED